MLNARTGSATFIGCALMLAFLPSIAAANNICVNPKASNGCYSSIQAAVNHASKNDIITVAPGTYQEAIVISTALSLVGSDSGPSIIDATNQPNGILVDGLTNPRLDDVTISGFTVKNANFEGILVVSASDVTIRNNSIVNNTKTAAVFGSGPHCDGQPAYETDESGDCGGGLHLIGTINSIVSGNLITGNDDGLLISDETRESRDNLITHNTIIDNAGECGIVLASHPRMGELDPTMAFSPHYGVTHNTVSENVSNRNGVQVGGSGVGLFSDGQGQGTVSRNVIIGNELIGNGLGGVDLHTHVGPSFGLPADNMDGNVIVGNFIQANGPDLDDTATPGPVGININSGQGGSPVRNTVIAQNTIVEEMVDVAINTPNEVDVHLNTLLGGQTGVAYICSFDKGTACNGRIDASENYWGCAAGPGGSGCTTASGSAVTYSPYLSHRKDTDPRMPQ